jgi:hypothetical protein
MPLFNKVLNALGRNRFVLALFLFIVLFLRRPTALTHPQFWAEDGAVFFHDQLLFGSSAIIRPYNGYLHLLSRGIAAVAALFAVAWAPFIYAVTAFSVAAFCCSFLAWPRFQPLLPCDAIRAVVCILWAAAFPAFELLGNVANLQWYLLIAAILLAIVPPRSKSRTVKLLIALLGGAIALSCPAAVIVAPLIVFDMMRGSRILSFRAGLLAGLSIQCVVMIEQHSLAISGLNAAGIRAPIAVFVALSNQVVLSSLLGQRHAYSLVIKGFHYAGLIALIAIGILLWRVARKSSTAFRLSSAGGVYLAVSSVAVAMIVRTQVSKSLESFGQFIRFGADRYFFCACCSFAYLAAILVLNCFPTWPAGRRNGLLFGLFTLAMIVNFPTGKLADMHFNRYAPQLETWKKAQVAREPHGAVTVPINPRPWIISLPQLTSH